MKRREPYNLSRSQVIAIYEARDLNKNIAADYGISTGLTSWIRRGKRHTRVVREWQQAKITNAALISAAFGVMQ